jgi:alpha-galactosidase/6-phospho-beta-glucosidase family protein
MRKGEEEEKEEKEREKERGKKKKRKRKKKETSPNPYYYRRFQTSRIINSFSTKKKSTLHPPFHDEGVGWLYIPFRFLEVAVFGTLDCGRYE